MIYSPNILQNRKFIHINTHTNLCGNTQIFLILYEHKFKSAYLYIHLLSIWLSTYLSIYLSLYLYIYLSRDGPYHRVRDYYVQAESTPVLDEDLVREIEYLKLLAFNGFKIIYDIVQIVQF